MDYRLWSPQVSWFRDLGYSAAAPSKALLGRAFASYVNALGWGADPLDKPIQHFFFDYLPWKLGF